MFGHREHVVLSVGSVGTSLNQDPFLGPPQQHGTPYTQRTLNRDSNVENNPHDIK